jgi:predicted RNase H-like nuclease (RuvC/YqgF family)
MELEELVEKLEKKVKELEFNLDQLTKEHSSLLKRVDPFISKLEREEIFKSFNK